jgi:hypothetical protein
MGMNKQQKMILIILIINLFFITFLEAQKKEIEEIKKFIKKKRVNAAYVMFGGNLFNLDTLNSEMVRMNYPKLPESHYSYGLGGHAIHNRFVVGLELLKFVQRKNQSSKEFNTSIDVRCSFLNFGYLVYSKGGLMAYPVLGAGIGKFILRTIENNITSFDDISSFQRGTESQVNNGILNLAFSVDYFYKYNKKKKGQNNLMFGFRGGLYVVPYKADWKVNYISVPDGPNSTIGGPYFRIVIGFGGWIEKLIEKAI